MDRIDIVYVNYFKYEAINKYILLRFNENFYLHDTKVLAEDRVLLHFKKIQTVQGDSICEPTAPPMSTITICLNK